MKNSKTLKIAIAAQMIALGVILSALSFNIPVFGVPAIRVDLIIIPIIIGGVILGKWFGIGIGVMVDIISYFSKFWTLSFWIYIKPRSCWIISGLDFLKPGYFK